MRFAVLCSLMLADAAEPSGRRRAVSTVCGPTGCVQFLEPSAIPESPSLTDAFRRWNAVETTTSSAPGKPATSSSTGSLPTVPPPAAAAPSSTRDDPPSSVKPAPAVSPESRPKVGESKPEPADGLNFGVQEDKLGVPRLIWGGVESPRRMFFDQVDDSKKPYVAVVGPPEFVGAARELLSGSLKPLADEFRIGYFGPTDWQVADVGLDRKGVYAFAADDGKGRAPVVHFQDNLNDLGPALIEARRRKDPDWSPVGLPDLRSGGGLRNLKALGDWAGDWRNWLVVGAVFWMGRAQASKGLAWLRALFAKLTAPAAPAAPPQELLALMQQLVRSQEQATELLRAQKGDSS